MIQTNRNLVKRLNEHQKIKLQILLPFAIQYKHRIDFFYYETFAHSP